MMDATMALYGIVLAVAGFFSVWWFRTTRSDIRDLWTAHREQIDAEQHQHTQHRHEINHVIEQLHQLRLHVAESYVAKPDLARLEERIMRELTDIKELLKQKADRP